VTPTCELIMKLVAPIGPLSATTFMINGLGVGA
jgi:hypothetical protein